jgi:cbb3-type cytochrome oxidase maturation protein
VDSLYLLVPLSVVLVFVIGALFWWSLQNGQYDDLEGPAYRILQDEDAPPDPGAASMQEALDLDQPSGRAAPIGFRSDSAEPRAARAID